MAQSANIVDLVVQAVVRVTERNIAPRTLKEFPFISKTSTNTDIFRATRPWKLRAYYLNSYGVQYTVVKACMSHKTSEVKKLVSFKGKGGCSRKRLQLV